MSALALLSACSDPPITGLKDPREPVINPPQAGQPAPQGGEAPSVAINPFQPILTQPCSLPTPQELQEMRLSLGPTLALRSPTSSATLPAHPEYVFVTEREGAVWAWRGAGAGSAQPQKLFESGASSVSAAEGLYALAFHPDFERTRALFTLASSRQCAEGELCVVLSRWLTQASAQAPSELPFSVLPNSEERLLEVPYAEPTSLRGALAFSREGEVYVSLGAGGPLDQTDAEGTDRPLRASLKGSVLRLNVDEPSQACGTNYSVPPTNPFAASGCVQQTNNRAELWAWGFKAPHHLSVDPVSGALWVSEHSSGAQAVSRVVGGADYAELPPLYQHTSPANANVPLTALTPFGVYRGDELPELKGRYLLSDAVSGEVIAFPVEQPALIDVVVPSNAPQNARNTTLWLTSTTGELSLMGAGGATGATLSLSSERELQGGAPRLLSQTGCLSDMASARWAEGVVPYELNQPFWSDLAEKERAFALPPNTQLEYQAPGLGFGLPVGALTLKTFYLTSRSGVRKRLETRILQRHERGWTGYTYRWRDDQLEADLLDEGLSVSERGPQGAQTWDFLDPSACLECHTEASNRTLGLEVGQLNRELQVEGGALNQLEAWAEVGYLTLPKPAAELPRITPLDVETNDLTREAREYLQVNCASCHRPGALPHLSFDLRADTPFSEAGLCDVQPTLDDLGVREAKLIAPGEPERSLILTRMRLRGPGQMPPLGSHLSDYAGVALVTFWISQLSGCER